MTLAERVNLLKFKYKLASHYGEDAEFLFVPRSELRRFCEALSDEMPDIGPKHHVYHWLSTGERELDVFDLKVRLLDSGSDIGVGRNVE